VYKIVQVRGYLKRSVYKIVQVRGYLKGTVLNIVLVVRGYIFQEECI
jgi:hypothetical protein